MIDCGRLVVAVNVSENFPSAPPPPRLHMDSTIMGAKIFFSSLKILSVRLLTIKIFKIKDDCPKNKL